AALGPLSYSPVMPDFDPASSPAACQPPAWIAGQARNDRGAGQARNDTPLFHLRLAAQVFLEFGDAGLLQLLLDLRLHFFQLRQLRFADIFQADDVPAELAL